MSSTVCLHTYTPTMVALYHCNSILSCLDKYSLAQLKFTQNTTIKKFFLVHYFVCVTLLHSSSASLILSPSNMTTYLHLYDLSNTKL